MPASLAESGHPYKLQDIFEEIEGQPNESNLATEMAWIIEQASQKIVVHDLPFQISLAVNSTPDGITQISFESEDIKHRKNEIVKVEIFSADIGGNLAYYDNEELRVDVGDISFRGGKENPQSIQIKLQKTKRDSIHLLFANVHLADGNVSTIKVPLNAPISPEIPDLEQIKGALTLEQESAHLVSRIVDFQNAYETAIRENDLSPVQRALPTIKYGRTRHEMFRVKEFLLEALNRLKVINQHFFDLSGDDLSRLKLIKTDAIKMGEKLFRELDQKILSTQPPRRSDPN